MYRVATDHWFGHRHLTGGAGPDTLQGDGTAGQLLKDKQLYENMNGAVGELRALVRDIRADPRKFLNVRVSLF